MSTIVRSSASSVKSEVKSLQEGVIVIVQLIHLACLTIGPLIAIAYISSTIYEWLRPLESGQGTLLSSPPFQTLLQGRLGAFVVFYSLFVWIFYILPSSQGSAAAWQGRRLSWGAVWKHVTLWSLVFGPVGYLCGLYTGMSWLQWGLLAVGLFGAFYVEVWKTFAWQVKMNRQLFECVRVRKLANHNTRYFKYV